MKKAFDQTVRDLKREVNKKVLKVPGIEQKILDATSNEPWGPHGSHLAEIAQATRNSYEYQLIMTVIWKRINDTGKNWRHVYKGLTVLEYLVAHGSERVIDDIKEHAYQISSLSDFQYIDSKGRDQGNNVRKKSQSLVALVNDRERITEVREKAFSNKDKFRSAFATDGNFRSGSRYDEDRYDSRYGSRDDDRNGYGRERDGGYRDDDRHGRYGRDSEDHYTYRDDEYRGRNRDDDYKFGSRSKSAERSRDRPYDDDDRYSPRNGGGRSDGPSNDPRPLERKLSDPNMSAPSYEEATKETPSVPEARRDERPSDIPAPKATLPPQPKASPESTSTAPVTPAVVAPLVPVAVDPPTFTSNMTDTFDEFDPRGFTPAMPASGNGVDVDLFGSLMADDSINSLALVPVSSSTTSEPDASGNSGFSSNFVASSLSQTTSNPFGDVPFMAIQDDFVSQPLNNAPASFHPDPGFASVAVAAPQAVLPPNVEAGSTYDFGDSFQATSGFPPAAVADTNSNNDVLEGLFPPNGVATSFATHGSLPRTQTAPSEFTQSTQMEPPQVQTPQSEFLSQSGLSAPPLQAPPSTYSTQQMPPNSFGMMPKAASMNNLVQSGSGLAAPVSLRGNPLTSQGVMPTKTGAASQPKDKFEAKSTVWADTINRGLVNLDISGPKTNPTASLGIDFDSLNRKDKLKEKSAPAPVSTIAMGKAMGSGSGVGRAGAGGIVPPPNPMMGIGMGMGVGMGAYGAGMAQPMGMGMGMGMGVHMGMGMNQGIAMRPNPGMPPPLPGMPGPAYNPAMSTGGYGSQPYGGYR